VDEGSIPSGSTKRKFNELELGTTRNGCTGETA